jgi:RNA polymerase sigma-70 factor, ECF subfamily
LLIRRGFAALERSEKLRSEKLRSDRQRAGPRASEIGSLRGPYVLQAEIAACHARAQTPEDTHWTRIVELYSELAESAPSPVVELNRAVAVGMAFGPAAGLELADRLISEPALGKYHLLPSVRADLLKKLGRLEEARAEFERAAAMTRNVRERALLLDRAKACSAN